MRQFNKFRGTKGFIRLWQHTRRFRDMITEEAKKRVKILAFWEQNGERPHYALRLQSPVQFLVEKHPEQSRMWWPDTQSAFSPVEFSRRAIFIFQTTMAYS